MSTALPDWARRARVGWRWTGAGRPPFADTPKPGQESVWDYPRPPRLDPVERHVLVQLGGCVIADTRAAVRVLETAHPPTYYIPRADVRSNCLVPEPGTSLCEWKGAASYWTVRNDEGVVAERGAWSYEDPFPEFEAIRGHVSFYPARFECFVDGERVRPQPGGFYAGWVTSDVAGPFKGGAGSAGW